MSGPSTAIDVLRKDLAYNRFLKEVGSCGIISYVIAARWIWLWNNSSQVILFLTHVPTLYRTAEILMNLFPQIYQ